MSHEPLCSRAVVCRRPYDPKRDIDREARATKRELRQMRCIHYAPISLLTRRQNVNKRARSRTRGLRKRKDSVRMGWIGS